ncbi:MAG: hypothetical protein H7242_07465 [Microbacteriaceae bacterium]|nr:hypothetical protein [Burkholderiaceae bacterium]
MKQADRACSRDPAGSSWAEWAPWQRDAPLALERLYLQLQLAVVYCGVAL